MRVYFLSFLFILCQTSFAQVSEYEFNYAKKQVQENMQSFFQNRGVIFHVFGNWTQEDPIAHASFAGDHRSIHVSGHYARLPGMSYDSFLLILCHETGHASKGAPLNYGESIEGQSDYFSTLNCFKRIAIKNNNSAFKNSNNKAAHQLCQKSYTINSSGYLICIRGMLAAQNLIKANYPNENISLGVNEQSHEWSYDPTIHPGAQCRLDTLKAGLLCKANGDVSGKDYRKGTCLKGPGSRPSCWFNPELLSF